ncbi:peptidoglycan recognition protein [Streptomyces sp. NPDC056165]|uniref:peptidoglycan recognition protein family protein n=1 Tax=Streptomyces sp. NPDC056165 TaxID=3345733 RepID=UPI0035DAC5FE
MSKIRGMRRYGFLACSIGATCAAALVLTPGVTGGQAGAVPASASATGAAAVPGSTRSLPLVPLTRDPGPGRGSALEQGLRRADVRHFSLVGVVWDDPDVELHGSVRIRTRSAATGVWSVWQDIDTHSADHGADPGTAERTSGHVRGATAPLWVGDCDGVDVRVRADAGSRDPAARPVPLPSGLRLELVDPGAQVPARGTGRGTARAGGPSEEVFAADTAPAAPGGDLTDQRRAQSHVGSRPGIVTRRSWGADESLREKGFVYTKKVKVAFVHHTASGNNYSCAQAPAVIRGIYRYHVKSMGWRDVGYNFLIDKCGTIYEGRAGGVAKPVLGAHTMGFNSNSAGIAVIGTYNTSEPSSAAVTAIARLTAWKLGLYGMNPRGKTYLTSGGGNLYQKGKSVRLNVISGHRDGFATDCPGQQLYGKLGTARSAAARYQGR